MPVRLEQLDARIPAWDNTSLGQRRCPFCKSDGTERYIRPDELHVRQCSICKCYFVSPSPSKEHLAEFYSTYFAHHRSTEFQQYQNDPVLVKEMLSLKPLSDVKVRTLSSLMDFDSKRVLDVGFGMGQGLVLMKKLGADVAGIDMDEDAVEFVRTKLHIHNVFTCDIMALPDNSTYELIALHDVIEHPLEPLEVLKRAQNLLSPGGLLSIWTPNATLLEAEDQPIALRVDLEHLQYLTFETCRFIATTLKMTIIYLEAHGTPRLESIRDLSRGHDQRRAKRALRRLLGPLPGFIPLNALRRKYGTKTTLPGNYHLFCVMKNEPEAAVVN